MLNHKEEDDLFIGMKENILEFVEEYTEKGLKRDQCQWVIATIMLSSIADDIRNDGGSEVVFLKHAHQILQICWEKSKVVKNDINPV